MMAITWDPDDFIEVAKRHAGSTIVIHMESPPPSILIMDGKGCRVEDQEAHDKFPDRCSNPVEFKNSLLLKLGVSPTTSSDLYPVSVIRDDLPGYEVSVDGPGITLSPVTEDIIIPRQISVSQGMSIFLAGIAVGGIAFAVANVIISGLFEKL